MHKQKTTIAYAEKCVAFLLAILTLCITSNNRTLGQANEHQETPKLPTREILVPMADLSVLLGSANERIFLTRAEYDALLIKAKVTPEQIAIARQTQLDESKIPTGAVMLDALHSITIETGRATIQSELNIDVLKPGLQSVHLNLKNVGLIEASLDNSPAMLSPSLDPGSPGATLFVTEKGRHRLNLKMVAAVTTSAAQQSFTIALPHATANQWTMDAPGNVEILSGASVRSRTVDAVANMTHFDWIPVRIEGQSLQSQYNVVMTLNNKMLRDTRALEAKSFLWDEITEAFEQVTQRVSIHVLNGAENKFRIAIPNAFEVKKVESPLLSRWITSETPQPEIGSDRVLEIELREPVSDQVVLDIVASKPANGLYTDQPIAWKWPVWRVMDAESQTAVLSISLESGLRIQSLEHEALIPIDGVGISAALPTAMHVLAPTAPNVRSIASFYAPDASQFISGQITKPKSTSRTSLNVLTTISNAGVRARALVDFESGNESVANIDVSLPQGWRMQSVSGADGQPLPFEILEPSNARPDSLSDPTRTRIRLTRPLAPLMSSKLVLECSTVPKGWLSEWSDQSIEFPSIKIVGTEAGPSVLSSVSEGDFTIDVSKAENLIALFESERLALKIQGDGSGPSFSAQSQNWSLQLTAKRKESRLTAEVFSFFRVESEGLKHSFELHFAIKEAAADRFQFWLPESTPSELTIRGMDGVVVKETTSRTVSGKRFWSIKLANRVSGVAKIQVDFSTNLETGVEMLLPIPYVIETIYQTGIIAIEGDDELEVLVTKHPRIADVGELTESSYSLGNRLLAVYGYSAGDLDGDSVTIQAARRELQLVPNTIVERAQLSTALSAHGASYHFAELRLRTTGGFLQAELPLDAVLWSVLIDGAPALPQRNKDQLLIELRPSARVAQNTASTPLDPNLRVLQIAYETPIKAIGMWTDVEVIAPSLATLQTAAAPSTAIPLADMEWRVWVPEELRIIESKGDLRIQSTENSGFPYNIPSVLAKTLKAPIASSFVLVTEDRYATNQGLHPPMLRRNTTLTAQSEQSRSQVLPPSKSIVPMPQSTTQQTDSDDPFGSAVPLSMPSVARRAQVAEAVPPAVDDFSRISNQKSLEGLRTLPINFEGPTTWKSFTLTGFGDAPGIRLSIVNNGRLLWLAGSIAALIVAFGLARLSRPLGQVTRWALSIMALAVAAPLLSPWPIETGTLASGCFYAALAILALRVLRVIVRSISLFFGRNTSKVASATALLVLILASPEAREVQSQDIPIGKDVRNLEGLLSILKSHEPPRHTAIEIPMDAILVPYQPDLPPSQASAEKILVPFSIYTQLMSLADPEKEVRKRSVEPTAEFSLSNLSYKATLDRDDLLMVAIRIDVTPHIERRLLVPFGIQGAVLTSAKLNGEPASVSSGPNGLALLVQGMRTQSFVATFQIPIQRQGGWRIVNAVLPSASMGKLNLLVPSANTEVRLLGVPDLEQRETTQGNQRIETSVAENGKLSLQWRPKVSESAVDQGLSVDSDCSLSIEEHGIHAIWNVKLEFRRGRRDSFEFELPKDLVVAKVSGKNIKGWTTVDESDRQVVKVALLKSAVESEQLSMAASRFMRLGAASPTTVQAPRLLMPEAMLQRGKITVSRSALLELEVAGSNGLVREDLRSDPPTVSSSSPVPAKSFQAYRFASPEYQLSLKVSEIATKVQSQTQTVLRISRNDSRLESEINVSAGSRPIFRVRIRVPEDWKWDSPKLEVPFEWTLSEPKEGSRMFDILFLNGQRGRIPISLSASQNRISDLQSSEYTAKLPKLKLLDAISDQGEVHIFSDIGVDVRPEQLEGCELVGRPAAARGSAQQALIPGPDAATPKAIIRYTTSNYEGQLRFLPRTPLITALSISNVKVTRRSLEETIYLEWEIKEAGSNRFEFTLPARLKDAVVLAQMVRSIQRVPTADQTEATIQYVIELQEDVMGQYRVLVQKDSPLPTGLSSVSIPGILTGTVENRIITLENSGRDELVVDSLSGVTQMVRGDSQWIQLQALLGGKSADVYRVDQSTAVAATLPQGIGPGPSLSFKSQSRSVVETASARIGLAKCLISVDDASNYRATQEFRIENTSEAYLELEMPSGAQLWTAMVAGKPVKPIQSTLKPTRTGAKRLRLPLVRTQTGDLDYGVELKYAGKLSTAGFTSKLDFPLIESININVELSQVKLLLPENQYWYGFAGTLGQVQDESDFFAGWLAHKNKQIGRLSEITARGSELFSKARAEENLKQLESTVKLELGNTKFNLNSNSSVQEQVQRNDFISNEAKAQVAKSESEAGQRIDLDNRSYFNGLLDSQRNYRANGNVEENAKSVDNERMRFDKQATDKQGAVKQETASQAPTTQLPNQAAQTLRNLGKRSQVQLPGQPAYGDSKDSKELAGRYRSKLQSQSNQVQLAPTFTNDLSLKSAINGPTGSTGSASGYGTSGDQSGMAMGGMGGRGEGNTMTPWQSSGGTSSMTEFAKDNSRVVAAENTSGQGYMTSLEIALPQRGKEFFFTSPRGESVLSANGISKSISQRVIGLAMIFIAIILATVRRKSTPKQNDRILTEGK